MSDDSEKKELLRRARAGRTTQAVSHQRVMAVHSWLVAGQRTKQIHQLITETARQERRKRDDARKLLAAGEKAELPPMIWGDADPPVSERMVGVYIAKAKQLMEAEGRELSKSAVAVLGWTWARINDLYWRALADKRYSVCRHLIRDTMDMFGLVGAIRVQLIAPGQTDPNAPDPHAPVPETSMTDEQLQHEWGQLARLAVARMRASMKASPGQPPESGPLPVPPAGRAPGSQN